MYLFQRLVARSLLLQDAEPDERPLGSVNKGGGRGNVGLAACTHIKRFDLGQQVPVVSNPIVTSTGARIGGSPSPLSSRAPREGD